MAEETKVIPKGSATPYVAIFNSNGKPIIDPLTNLPIGVLVTSFQYEFVEMDEDDDEGDNFELVIETNNTDLVSIRDLYPQHILRLQWGWIFHDGTSVSGPEKKVSIEEIKCNFSENGVKITITGCDPFTSMAKNTPPLMRNGVLFEQWMDYVVRGGGISVEDYYVKDEFVQTTPNPNNQK